MRAAHVRALGPVLALMGGLLFCAGARALQFDFRAPATVADAATPALMRDLAERLIPVYQDADPDRYLATLSALQTVAGDPAAADASRQELRERHAADRPARPLNRSIVYDLYASARAREADQHVPFADGFKRAVEDTLAAASDQEAYALGQWLAISPSVYRIELQRTLDELRPKDSIDQPEAVQLVWKYLAFDAHRTFAPLVDALEAADQQRRYIVEDGVTIRTRDGTRLSALVIRPRAAVRPLPALLEFTIYESQNYARECAAHGYVGVVAYARGKRASVDPVIPYEHDGADARAVIEWIAGQTWSDGRVGMYGSGYSGFTSWAAAKRMPSALKAIATAAADAPGIDVPLQGGIFQNSAYRWSLHATNTRAADETRLHDELRWRAFDERWYRSGRRYRDLGRSYGRPNPIFIRWLNHPSYDRYWQKMLPHGAEFAHVDIPVLTVTGYYAPSEPGDLYYFAQHLKHAPHADHRLLVGPYDDAGVDAAEPAPLLEGYAIDPAARVDLHELRYQWFDHVFKGATLPPLLAQAVNYQVMGANTWRHASSLEAMAPERSRYYLDAAPSGFAASRAGLRLSAQRSAHEAFVPQTVDFADRKDADVAPRPILARSLAIRDEKIFVSEPVREGTEIAGLLSGRLDFAVNKTDMDVELSLYELLATGDYIRLFSPAHAFRASYARDRAHRRLLRAGERQVLAFASERITARQLKAGSRLVVVLGIVKRPDREVNYGTGNDVSEESISDAGVPLKIRWYDDSFVELPIRPGRR